MSKSSHLVSAIFTALPGSVYFILFLLSGWLGREYWWETYFAVLTILLIVSILFGFALPTMLQKLRLRKPWTWIVVQGVLAWTIALVLLGLLNMTPLCVGQDNGDGNNDLGMCLFMTALSGIVYSPVYLAMLTASSLIGHWLLSFRNVE